MAGGPGGVADLVVRNARIVDGSGRRAFDGDVAVAGGRILHVGRFGGGAARSLDAGGRVVATGFIDIHTHYDAQLCWDGLATPSPLHGVTTIVTGNCSLSLAPVRGNGRDRIAGMFEIIEDIRAASFDAGVGWEWEHFPEYLDAVSGGLGPNLSPLVGHSALRLYVMGEASQAREATDAEIAQMAALLGEAIRAGAKGLSLSHLDVDENLRPVPSRFADLREKLALARTVVAEGGRILQTVPDAGSEEGMRGCIAELGAISRETGILCTLQPIVYYPALPDLWRRSLDWLEQENAGGARVYGQTSPRPLDFNLRLSETFFPFFLIPSWGEVMRRGVDERREMLADPARRGRLAEEGALLLTPFLEKARVGRSQAPVNRALEGRPLTEVAEERGAGLVETMIEISLEDDLAAEFRIEGALHGDAGIRAQILAHPWILVGASDAGAHLSQFCGAADATSLLSEVVRKRGEMGLEEAVHRLTGQPAEVWGMSGRGRLEEGRAADLVVFDPDHVGPGPEEFRSDVPGGANRYVQGAVGVEWVVVAGEVLVERGCYTDARSGRIVD
jgi:N-acyl-D-aspartate/D-glutamate deacylase